MTTRTAIVGILGCGVTGGKVAQYVAGAGVRVAIHDPAPAGIESVVRRTKGVRVEQPLDLAVCDVVVVASPAPHAARVGELLRLGVNVVSVGDDLADTRHLLDLHETAVASGARLVVGAGLAPGLSGLLARHLSRRLDTLDELHVAVHGTAGPACARQHHENLGSTSLGWHDGEWTEPPGGSGRDLVWFPEPIAAHDCYRAALCDPLLLHRSFPTAVRISARTSATRRDRVTARLPMLTPPHAGGDLGAVRVEARGGLVGGARHTVIAGASGATGELAGSVAAAVAVQLLRHPSADSVAPGVHLTSDEVIDLLDVLHVATTMGVRVQEFTGVARATHW
ncbi:MAG: hypothetical protein RLZ04_2609 [Actinomycetota bacterium]|jgi:hypothetical protein